MIPLSLFLSACVAVYLGVIDASFSALMRVSLRLAAERSDRPGALGQYLEDPLLLFIPVRFLLGVVTAIATELIAAGVGVGDARTFAIVMVGIAIFIVGCEILLPIAIVGRD